MSIDTSSFATGFSQQVPSKGLSGFFLELFFFMWRPWQAFEALSATGSYASAVSFYVGYQVCYRTYFAIKQAPSIFSLRFQSYSPGNQGTQQGLEVSPKAVVILPLSCKGGNKLCCFPSPNLRGLIFCNKSRNASTWCVFYCNPKSLGDHQNTSHKL